MGTSIRRRLGAGLAVCAILVSCAPSREGQETATRRDSAPSPFTERMKEEHNRALHLVAVDSAAQGAAMLTKLWEESGHRTFVAFHLALALWRAGERARAMGWLRRLDGTLDSLLAGNPAAGRERGLLREKAQVGYLLRGREALVHDLRPMSEIEKMRTEHTIASFGSPEGMLNEGARSAFDAYADPRTLERLRQADKKEAQREVETAGHKTTTNAQEK